MTGPDEDATTLAVAAVGALLDAAGPQTGVNRVVVVTRHPALLEGPTTAVIAAALDLSDDVRVEIHLGGGPAVLDVLLAASPGDVVVGVDPDTPAGAAAAVVGHSGASLAPVARVGASLPHQVRAPGEAVRVCDDPRLLRDLGWRQAISAVGDTAGFPSPVVVGLPAKAAAALGAERSIAEAVGSQGAAAPLLALAELADRQQDALLVALEGDGMTAVRVSGAGFATVIRDEPAALFRSDARDGETPSVAISGSAAAFARAFEAKVGFAGGRCQCGALELPPRYRCLSCGEDDAWRLERLPRTGTVYSAVTIHAPVPGRATPYTLAIVDVDGVGVRHLAPLTGGLAGSVAIGDHGRLVLRRLADREIGPDYGWAFMANAQDRVEVPA